MILIISLIPCSCSQYRNSCLSFVIPWSRLKSDNHAYKEVPVELPDDGCKSLRWLKPWQPSFGNHSNVISLYIFYNGLLLQLQDKVKVSNFIIYFNVFGEFDNFED